MIKNTRNGPVCNNCDSKQYVWDVDIHDDYFCWKCNKSIKIILLYYPYTEKEIKDSKFSDFSYEKPLELIKYAATKGVRLAKRYSKTTNSSYVMHICSNCNSVQGDFFIVEDNHQDTKLLERLRLTFCSVCNKWHEEKLL